MSQSFGATFAALAPLVLVALVFVIWCLIDMQNHEVRYLPRVLWMAIALLSIPLGGIIYLLVGRGEPIRRNGNPR